MGAWCDEDMQLTFSPSVAVKTQMYQGDRADVMGGKKKKKSDSRVHVKGCLCECTWLIGSL